MSLLSKCIDLFGLQAGEGEHSDLGFNVFPLSWSLEFDELVVESFSHGNDSVGHSLDLYQPFVVELRGTKDGADKSGTVDGRVGVEWSNDNLELRVDSCLLIGIGTDKRDGSDSFAVQPEVLGKDWQRRIW